MCALSATLVPLQGTLYAVILDHPSNFHSPAIILWNGELSLPLYLLSDCRNNVNGSYHGNFILVSLPRLNRIYAL